MLAVDASWLQSPSSHAMSQPTPPVFRFAPSPNGYLHVGHALSALLNYEEARRRGGRFLLRIEDIDVARCRPEYESAIYEDLAWLGIAWEQPVRRQSEHFQLYREALDRLDAMGLLYPAFESRAEIAAMVKQREAEGVWPRDPDGAPIYPGRRNACLADRERRMASGAPYALRLRMRAASARTGALVWTEQCESPDSTTRVVARPENWGDVVLARKEVTTSYHLSVVVDDALQGVTHVIRGQDLFHATSVHRLLQDLLGLPAPVYRHHRLVCDEAGRKLSKSTGAVSLRDLRRSGATVSDIRQMIGL